MQCKYYLMVGSSVVDIDNKDNCIDATSMINNRLDIKGSLSRVDFGGVIRKCGSEIKFSGEAREMLIKEYRAKYLKSQAAIAIYAIDNNWEYSIKSFECPLDFGKFSWDSNLAYINCIDNSAAAVIKANKSTQYEYPVSDLKEESKLYYDGISVRNEVTFEFAGNSVENESYTTSFVEGSSYCIWIPPFNYVKENLSINNSIDYCDQKEGLTAARGQSAWDGSGPNTNTTSCFLECMQDCTISLDLTNLRVWGRNESMENPYYLNLMFQLYKIPISGLPECILGQMPSYRGTDHDYYCEIKGDFSLLKGEKLQLVLRRFDLFGDIGIGKTTFYMSNEAGEVVWNDLTDPVDIDVVSPVSLLNKLLLSMSGSIDIRGEIKETVNGVVNERLKNTMLAAAESIRGMKEAKIYSSFSKFCEFMEAEFGYVYDITPCEPSGSGSPGIVLKDYLNFDGFLDYSLIDNVLDSPKEGEIVQIKYADLPETGGIFFACIDSKYYFYWNGCENYQDYGDWFSTSLKKNAIFRDETAGIYYQVKDNRLVEYQLDKISIRNYNVISEFGGFIKSNVTDSGIYTGPVYVENILKGASKFMYYNGTEYYSDFFDSINYNSEDGIRKDAIFVNVNDTEYHDEGQAYVTVNSSDLMRYKGAVPLLTKDQEAALVTFKHRSEVFKDVVVKKIKLYNEPEYRIEDGRIYSEVQIGYEKQDYDNGNNGYDEFNFTYHYSTGITIKNSTFTLICPFRADCYGFEELAEKRGAEKSSTESDTHVFLINVSSEKVDGKYQINRTLIVEGAYTDTVFNATYAPIFMIEANKSYIGMFAQRLTFASSEGNSNIKIDGRRVSADVKISDRLFTCADISITTNDVVLPEDWEGLIEFEWDKYAYFGYLKNVDAGFEREEAFKYDLIEKEQICTQ